MNHPFRASKRASTYFDARAVGVSSRVAYDRASVAPSAVTAVRERRDLLERREVSS